MQSSKKPFIDGTTIGFHCGHTLATVAGAYETLLKVILEQVQNALDAGACKIEIVLNKRILQLIVRDNGRGVDVETFHGALGQVCQSIKDKNKLGRFGIGVVSPFGKCEKFTFTSCPGPEKDSFVEWTFATEDIKQQAAEIKIPCRQLAHLTTDIGVAGKTSTWWRTEVFMVGITTDRVLSKVTMNSLVEACTSSFGATMRKLKTKVTVKIVDENGKEEDGKFSASSFTGNKLKEREIVGQDCGKTQFRLYIARKKKGNRKGKVLIGETDDDFRFTAADLARSAAKDYLDQEVVSALLSGIFEGEILSEKAKLHVGRKKFEHNEALMDFCDTVNQWFKAHGKKHVTEANETREEERFQDLGLKSLKSLEKLLQDPRFEQFKSVIGAFKIGTVGSGHTQVPGIDGLTDQPAVSVRGGGGKKHKKHHQNNGHNGKKDEPDKEREGQMPLTSAGPLGRHRRTIRSNSLGLEFRHERMEGSDDLYKFDETTGVLTFNIRHPTWVECAEKDRTVMALQEFIAIQVLTLMIVPEDWRDQIKTGYDELVSPFAFLAKIGAFGNRAVTPA